MDPYNQTYVSVIAFGIHLRSSVPSYLLNQRKWFLSSPSLAVLFAMRAPFRPARLSMDSAPSFGIADPTRCNVADGLNA